MNVGRPPLFETPEELQTAIAEYFSTHENCATITGLALYLGFCDRQSLYDYEKKPEFSCMIKEARLRVESSYELALYGKNPTGPIFALKNMGWKDRTETELSGHVNTGFDLSKLSPEALQELRNAQTQPSND